MAAIWKVTRSGCCRAIICAVLSIFSCAGANAAPWGRLDKERITLSRAEVSTADRNERRFRQAVFQTYTEWGVGRDVTLGGKVASAIQETGVGDLVIDRRGGLIEAEAFVQRRLMTRGQQVFAARLLYAAPSALRSQALGRALDDRDAAVEAAALWGQSNERSFVAVDAGYRRSLGADAHQFRGQMTYGRYLGRRVMLLTDVNITAGLGGVDPGGADYDVVKLTPSLLVVLADRKKTRLDLRAGLSVDLVTRGTDPSRAGFIELWLVRKPEGEVPGVH